MSQINLKSLKMIVYGIIILFILFCVIGFLSGVANLFLLPLLLYFVLGIALIVLTSKFKVEGKLKFYTLLTGLSSVGFTVGVIYGVLGIWGFYDIYDPIYLTTVIAFGVGFIIGAIGSIILFKRDSGLLSQLAN